MINTLKTIALWIAFYVVLIGVILQASYFGLNYFPDRNKIVSEIAAQLMQRPVQIHMVSFDGSILEPVLSLQDVTIAGRVPIQLQQLQVIIDVWKSLDRQQWVTKKFVIDGLKLRIDQNDKNNVRVGESGLSAALFSLQSLQDIAAWVLVQPQVDFLQTQIAWYHANQPRFVIPDVSFVIANKGDQHTVAANASLQKNEPPALRLVVHSVGNPFENRAARVTFYLENLRHFVINNSHVDEIIASGVGARSNQGWRIDANTLKYRDRHLAIYSQLSVELSPTKPATIEIHGDAKLPDLHHILDYFPSTFFPKEFSTWLKTAILKGNFQHIQFSLHAPLTMPFDWDRGNFIVDADLQNATINYDSAWPVLDNLNAHLHLDNKGFTLTARDATMDKNTIQTFSARVPSFSHPVLFVQASMKTDWVNAMALLKKTPLLIANQLTGVIAKGPTQCDLELQIPLDSKKIEVSAQGKVMFYHDHLAFPKWHVYLSELMGALEFHGGNFLTKNLRATIFEQPIWLALESQKNKYNVKTIRVQASGDLNPVTLARYNDFSFLKAIPEKIAFHVSTVFESGNNSLSPIAISLGDFHLWNQLWHHLALIIHLNAKDTLIQLHSQEISGDIVLPAEKQAPIRANFEYLLWVSKKNSLSHYSENAQSLNPSAIPSLDLSIRNLYVNHENNGKVVVSLRAIREGVAIRALKIQSPLLQMEAAGEWIKHDFQMQTQLNGQAESEDLGKLLSQHQLSSRLKNGILLLDFALRWTGAPQQFSLLNAEGSAHVTVRDGRIMQLDSDTETNLTLGRLLNLFSLESVGRFLNLDFLPFAKKGFPFDILQGKFEMARGDLFARDTEIDGSLAKINLNGKISLADQSNDLKMTVFPKISSSLPMIAGLAGGPVVGAVAWVANKVVSPRVGKMMEMDYHISGTLDKPIVSRVN